MINFSRLIRISFIVIRRQRRIITDKIFIGRQFFLTRRQRRRRYLQIHTVRNRLFIPRRIIVLIHTIAVNIIDIHGFDGIKQRHSAAVLPFQLYGNAWRINCITAGSIDVILVAQRIIRLFF